MCVNMYSFSDIITSGLNYIDNKIFVGEMECKYRL